MSIHVQNPGITFGGTLPMNQPGFGNPFEQTYSKLIKFVLRHSYPVPQWHTADLWPR
jgi:hypothetical protein